ncbi:polysaccharide biosynthesis protein [Candidatus Micrarchaeota archaeon]|nr:polysaccharide biosynthesis protein [Candidatus Micrarchaeota archaeon]
MNDAELKNVFKGKNILVTGGAGSIGSELVKHLLKYEPKVVRILDINESGLFDLEQEYKEYERQVRILIGDVRDKDRLMKAMEGIDFVFHAAALKHVYINEYSPLEAVKTNVLGTQNLFDAAIENNVEKVIFISTDKAVNPTSVMGTSKLLAEKLTTAANYQKGSHRTIFSSVRFGNVLASRGSVIPLFINQIKKGGPVTITDPQMTRFIMSSDRAIGLILKAASLAHGGEIFILKMPTVKIMDLAEVLIDRVAPAYGFNSNEIKIEIIGSRPGEKLHEFLVTNYERENLKEINDLLVLVPSISAYYSRMNPDTATSKYYKSLKPMDPSNMTSSEHNPLNKKQINKILDEIL